MIKVGKRQGATATTRNHKSMNRTKSFINHYTFGISPEFSGSLPFNARRAWVNGHVGDPVVIEFIECATRKRRGIPATSETAGSGL
jgi:hypothetical protein